MDGRGSLVVVVGTAHEALGHTLVNHEEDLGCHLCTQENGFLAAVTAGGGAGTLAGAGGIGVALVFELRVVLGQAQSLDRVGGLRVAGRAVLVHDARIEAGGTGHASHARVVVSGGNQERVHTVRGRVVHRTGLLAHGGRGISSTSGEGSGEGGGDFGSKDSGGRRKDELLGDDAKQSLGEAWKCMLEQICEGKHTI